MKLIIPYRLKSSRFPNKYISNFLKRPLIEHSIKLCQSLGDVIVTAPKEDYVKEVSDLHSKYKFDCFNFFLKNLVSFFPNKSLPLIL